MKAVAEIVWTLIVNAPLAIIPLFILGMTFSIFFLIRDTFRIK